MTEHRVYVCNNCDDVFTIEGYDRPDLIEGHPKRTEQEIAEDRRVRGVILELTFLSREPAEFGMRAHLCDACHSLFAQWMVDNPRHKPIGDRRNQGR